MQPNTNIPQPVLDEVIGVMQEIDAELLRVAAEDSAPLDIRSYMARISGNLRKFPDIVHLLSDEQIAPYYTAVLKQNELILQPAKKKAAAKKDTVAASADIDSGNLFGF